MKRALAFVFLTFSALAFSQTLQIKSGSKVFIEPAAGFGDFLAAALIEYKIPLVLVADKDNADYIVRSTTHEDQTPSWSTPYTYISAIFSLIEKESSQVVFAGSSSKNYNLKSAAEDCVSQLAELMEPTKKQAKSYSLAFIQSHQIKKGATIFFEPADGFEVFLAGAMIEYNVPLKVVIDKNKADYIIRSTNHQSQIPSWSTPYTYVEATFSLIDTQSSQIVFAASTSKNYNFKAAAEDCAKKIVKSMK
jgi:hypothetical protein